MENTSAILQQAAHTTYQLSCPSSSTRAIQKKAQLLTQNGEFSEKKSEWIISKRITRQKSKRTSEDKNKRGDRKGETNDSPAIPDRGTGIRHPFHKLTKSLLQYS